MRVTNNQIYLVTLQNLKKPIRRILENQTQLASGKRINRHADDPLGSGEVQKYKSQLANVRQYQKNIRDGLTLLQQTELALNRLESNLIRAKALTVQAANASNSRENREIIAQEINQILEEVLSVANTQFRDRYLFAGRNTTSRPFVEVRDEQGRIESLTLSADNSGEIFREIDRGVTIAVNIPGDDIFNLSTGPFATLLDLREALEKNDIEGIKKSLDAIDNVLDLSLSARTRIGARMQRMQNVLESQENTEINLIDITAQIEDADIAELTMKLAGNELSYRSAIGAAGRILQTSLVDILT